MLERRKDGRKQGRNIDRKEGRKVERKGKERLSPCFIAGTVKIIFSCIFIFSDRDAYPVPCCMGQQWSPMCASIEYKGLGRIQEIRINMLACMDPRQRRLLSVQLPNNHTHPRNGFSSMCLWTVRLSFYQEGWFHLSSSGN